MGGQLVRHSVVNVFLGEAVPTHRPSKPHGLGCRHGPHLVTVLVRTRFEQDGRLLEYEGQTPLVMRRHPLAEIGPNHRVDHVIEFRQCHCILENDGSQLGPIELASRQKNV